VSRWRAEAVNRHEELRTRLEPVLKGCAG